MSRVLVDEFSGSFGAIKVEVQHATVDGVQPFLVLTGSNGLTTEQVCVPAWLAADFADTVLRAAGKFTGSEIDG